MRGTYSTYNIDRPRIRPISTGNATSCDGDHAIFTCLPTHPNFSNPMQALQVTVIHFLKLKR
ncbi:hypothetical protein P5673_014025 [Acropora cervicornis]|uniref:Uncharacterized protein n=1 Tax=Acropora cervicornis TaxID=6130 RepID=A0AAD9QKS6_ACRCE|nr:hypothetical protein P5673_014025 [Acropora cervicornis]